jgi:stalled ribosome rescue protein Dom34
MKPKTYKRGYPVAILIDIQHDHATLWQIFSQVAKNQKIIKASGDRKDQKSIYNFHQTIIDEIRSILKEGVKSIIIVSPPRTSFAQYFLNHVKAHHNWLFQGSNKATFNQITGYARIPSEVASLAKTPQFKNLIEETTASETENLLELLEKRLSKTDNLVFFSLEEAENLIFGKQIEGKPAPEYLLLTNTYLSTSRQKNRVHRIIQIAANKKVQTRIINNESAAGMRLTQLGGLVCLAKI